jgi:hypothetical protein
MKQQPQRTAKAKGQAKRAVNEVEVADEYDLEEDEGKRQKKGEEHEEEEVEEEQEEEYEVEAIRGKRSSRRNSVEYEVKWKTYT